MTYIYADANGTIHERVISVPVSLRKASTVSLRKRNIGEVYHTR